MLWLAVGTRCFPGWPRERHRVAGAGVSCHRGAARLGREANAFSWVEVVRQLPPCALPGVGVLAGKAQAEHGSQTARVACISALAIGCPPSVSRVPHCFFASPSLNRPSLVVYADCLCCWSGGYRLLVLLPPLLPPGAAFTVIVFFFYFLSPFFLQLFCT